MTYTLIFYLLSSDTLQVLMFVCPTVSEHCFYACYHPCFFLNWAILLHIIIYYQYYHITGIEYKIPVQALPYFIQFYNMSNVFWIHYFTTRKICNKLVYCLSGWMGRWGHWAVYNTSPQSFKITFPNSIANNFEDFFWILIIWWTAVTEILSYRH